MKKIFKFLLIIFIVSALMMPVGCSIFEQGSDSSEDLKEIDLTADENYEGKLVIATTSAESEVEIRNRFVNSFEQKYKNIEVEIYTEFTPSNYTDSMLRQMNTSVQLGKPELMPDVLWTNDKMVYTLQRNDMLFPLGEIDEADDSFSVDDLVPQSVAEGSVDGMLYYIPRDYNEFVLYYNRNVFDACGIEYPKDGMTGEEFKTLLGELKTKIAALPDSVKNDYGVSYKNAIKYPLDNIGAEETFLWSLLKSFGGEIIDKEGNVKFDEGTAALDAIEYWSELIMADYTPEISASTGGTGNSFIMQTSAMAFQSRPVLTSIVNGAEAGKGLSCADEGDKGVGVVSVPNFSGTENYSIGSGSSGYAMYRYAQHKTEAWLFLKHIISEAGQNSFGESANGIPSLATLLGDSNATWRNVLEYQLPADFNHNAFVYAYSNEGVQSASCSDYLSIIPLDSQESVVSAFVTCFADATREVDGHLGNKEKVLETIADKAAVMRDALKG